MSAHLLAAILWALAQVETPNGVPAAPGHAGETGRWQLTPEVRQDRGRELRAAGIPVTDENLARAQIGWIRDRLQHTRLKPTPFDIALAWNAGVTATVNGRAPNRSYDFAARVANLVKDANK